MKQTNSILTLLVCAHFFFTGNSSAAMQADVPGPTGSGQFGYAVTVLPNGNIVVTDPYYDAPGAADVGAVYLYNSAGGLISTLTGVTANDRIGFNGVSVLSNGNYVVRSARWQNGGRVDAGAATWCGGTTGCSGTVSPANSLVGSSANDQVGNSVSALPNGHYLVRSTFWDNGALQDVGAVTWCNGTTGRTGTISSATSLIGTVAGDQIGGGGTRRLTNSNYVVNSPKWDKGAVVDAGASTFCDGSTGCVGEVTTANSLFGTQANDQVGVGNAVALPNGNYVVFSRLWHNGAIASAGAATWCNGTTGRIGAVSIANSLVGTKTNDEVGASGVSLTNGNYVVISSNWDNATATDAGAVTWCNGATGRTGEVSTANSLVGSTNLDHVGNYGVVALPNGNYVVNSPDWNAVGALGAGAATWCNGTAGCTGAVSGGNSLIGNITGDQVGSYTIPLTNSHYVVASSSWDNGGLANVGAATWCDGATGRHGPVTASNSLVGNQFGDAVGRLVTPLANGNYVVGSDNWDNGPIADAGAATWCDGTIGCTGAMSVSNSLVGTADQDRVGRNGITPLTNGNYVVNSQLWGNTDLGAVTWCDGKSGRIGAVSAANSLIGTHANDQVGGASALADGNYYVWSPYWDYNATPEAGAITLARGDMEIVGGVVFGNSVRGTSPSEGSYLDVDYNALTGQLVVGRPLDNIVSLFRYRGADFTVTTLDDHNDGTCNAVDCSLREAIIAANAVPDDDNTITFAPGLHGIFQLSGELPALVGNVTLQGPGANVLTVRRDSGGDYRIFTITNSTANGPIVKIAGLTISNGQAGPFMFPFDSGGGILNYRGTVFVQNCAITGNRAFLSGNDVGGGIVNYGGSVMIESSTLAGNVATNGGGIGSLREDPGTATITIRNSTLSGNSATGGSGGGIYNEARNAGSIADVILTNSTLSGNSATPAGFFGGAGGAIYNFGNVSGVVHTSVQDCTISDNNAPSAGGIYNRKFSATAELTLRNTILKTGTIGSNFINADGVITSLGHNLSSDDAAGGSGTGPGGYLTGSGDIRNTDPLLGPLQNNGGPTFTRALLNGSPAINAGVNASETSLDQRGFPRVATNDIGAFEFGSVSPAPPVLSAVSRKLHAGIPFDINLPLSGNVGIECRSGGANNDYQVVVNFANAVTYTGASVSFGAGSVSSSTGNGTNSLTVNLTGMTSGQTSTITLAGVSDGANTGDVSLLMAVLVGDTNGNAIVNSGDTLQTRSRSGQATDTNNFRSDVNADGFVNSGDTTAVRARSGTALPP